MLLRTILVLTVTSLLCGCIDVKMQSDAESVNKFTITKPKDGEVFLLNKQTGEVWRQVTLRDKGKFKTTFWSPMNKFSTYPDMFEYIDSFKLGKSESLE